MTETGSARSFRAFLVTLAALVVFSAFALRNAALEGFTAFAIKAVFLAFIACSIIFFHSRKEFASEAFSIPFLLFLANTGKSFITGNYADYFFLCLIISCLGALFLNGRQLFRYILISNVVIAMQVIMQMPVTEPESETFSEMTASRVLFNWSVSVFGSCAVYLVTAFAENKFNNAKQAQNSFVGALSSTPDPMILLDSDNKVTYISNSFMKMINLDRSFYAKGRPVFDLLKDRELRNLFYDLLTRRESFQTTREVTLDGQQYFFEIVVAKLASESGGYMLNIVDITPVMRAKFEAEAASRSKSAFLATMSHEIRTPLNAIIGLSEIELQKKLPPDTRTDLEKIHNSGGSLLAIINDILDISKIEAGSFELIPVDYDVPSLVNDTIQLNIVRKGSKNINFRLKIDSTIPVKLFGDELRVKQILNNLLSNAFKYTREGNVVLTITWEKKDDDAWILLSVQDTGSGIREDDIPRLFSEYRQLDAKANRHIEGTGLGLSITKNMIALMGGKIDVQSKYGKGSVFTVRIPQRIVDATPVGEEIARNLEQFRFKELHRSQGLRLVRNHMPYGKVLVVDDVETNLDVVKGLMLPYGLSIDTASSGLEAISKIRSVEKQDEAARYDLVFMDHMMPEMDGLETVRIIRNELTGTYGRSVPIIALTANALIGNENMFLASGFNAFIPKPIDVMQLDSALNTWVRNKQTTETLKKAEKDLARISAVQDTGILRRNPVAGLDTVQGLERYGSEAAYMDILRSWYVHTPALLATMKNIDSRKLPEYTITVHGLKGSCYGIFANDIGKKAEELEKFARAGDFDSVQAENVTLITMTEASLKEVGELLEKAAGSKAAKGKRASPDPGLLDQLLDAAKRYKSTLMEEIVTDIESYSYETGGELVEWLRGQMDNLEYDAICERLETLVTADTRVPDGS